MRCWRCWVTWCPPSPHPPSPHGRSLPQTCSQQRVFCTPQTCCLRAHAARRRRQTQVQRVRRCWVCTPRLQSGWACGRVSPGAVMWVRAAPQTARAHVCCVSAPLLPPMLRGRWWKRSTARGCSPPCTPQTGRPPHTPGRASARAARLNASSSMLQMQAPQRTGKASRGRRVVAGARSTALMVCWTACRRVTARWLLPMPPAPPHQGAAT
mmetsp:Transcript_34327/g.76218  ORF Transcript_34327/g.76218 Transcript_34327/m.76218 type:complete len:210 (+) Transcript_34327:1280-1909(+)